MVKILLHIIVSVMWLFSANGTTINMHFCQGHLYDLAFDSPAHDCCVVEADSKPCLYDRNMAESHYCDDESIRIKSSHNFISSGFTDDFEDFHSFELLSTSTWMFEYPGAQCANVSWIVNDKNPPQHVVLSQIQVFII